MVKKILFFLGIWVFISCSTDHEPDLSGNSTEGKSILSGKTFWTLFDSLGENTWQTCFSQLTGTVFHAELNLLSSKPITMGGTATSPSLLAGTLGRAQNLVSYKEQYPIDIVFIENVNDIHTVSENGTINGSIDDSPWMIGEKMIGYADNFGSYAEAKQYVSAHISEILNNIKPERRNKGSVLTFPYTNNNNQNGYRIKILSKATKPGYASVCKNSEKFSFPVTPETEIEEIIACIVQYCYGAGWTAVNNGDNSATISYYIPPTSVISFDDGGTGIQSQTMRTSSTQEYCLYFTGNSSDNWCDTHQWAESISLWACYKGLVEYLREQLPHTELYWFIPTYYNIDFNDPSIKNTDGTFSPEKYEATPLYKRWQALKECQIKVCEYYSLPVIDIDNLSGINLSNITEYYESNNVHPRKEGYKRWAETLSEELIRQVQK